jgi:hypothetical protein
MHMVLSYCTVFAYGAFLKTVTGEICDLPGVSSIGRNSGKWPWWVQSGSSGITGLGELVRINYQTVCLILPDVLTFEVVVYPGNSVSEPE